MHDKLKNLKVVEILIIGIVIKPVQVTLFLKITVGFIFTQAEILTLFVYLFF